MSVQAVYTSALSAIETVADAFASSGRKSVSFDGLNTSLTLDSTTTPAVSKQATFEKALVAGAGTIDLRALPGLNGAAVDGNGLKARVLKLTAKSTNAGVMTLTTGASNGHPLLGTGFSLTLAAGDEVLLLRNAGTTIDATHKTIDIAGTGTDALDCEIVLG